MSFYRDTNESYIVASAGDKGMCLYEGGPQYFGLAASSRGVTTFDYNRHRNVIVTGCNDGTCAVWNPIVPSKPLGTLESHKCKIVKIMLDVNPLDSAKPDRIITISQDGIVNVSALDNNLLLQTIAE